MKNKAEISETLVQELQIDLWDYDGYFPGVQGDDFLGRLVKTFPSLLLYVFLLSCKNFHNHFSISLLALIVIQQMYQNLKIIFHSQITNHINNFYFKLINFPVFQLMK